MNRCVAKLKDQFQIIPADRLEREDSIIFVYNGKDLVAMFDIGVLESIWLSEQKT